MPANSVFTGILYFINIAFCREEGIRTLWLKTASRAYFIVLKTKMPRIAIIRGNCTIWRKGRDSNPRYSHPVYSLSRTAHSTTLTPFRVSVHKCSNFLIYCNLIRIIYHPIYYILLSLSLLFLFFNE